MAMAFQEAGCTTAAICPPRGHPLLKTRGVSKLWPYQAFDPIESLIAAIEGSKPDLIVPCDDRAVSHLHELYARLKGPSGQRVQELIFRSLGSPASFSVLTSRYALMQTAGELGIRVPASMPVESAEHLREWATEQTPPWMLKADGTWGGHGIRIAHNLAEAERYCSELMRPVSAPRVLKRWIVNRDLFSWEPWRKHSSTAVMVQARIVGRPANSAVACWNGEVLAQICVEVADAQGDTGPATIVQVVENAEMMEAGEKLVSSLGLSGIVGLDFMIEDGSGAAHLIEMNPRCTPLCHLQLGEGHDLIGRLVAELSGQPPRLVASATDKKLVAYFPQAWRGNVASDLLAASFHDVPWQSPDLVQELLRVPWPDRSMLAQITDWLRGNSESQRASRRTTFMQPNRKPSSLVPLRVDGTKAPLIFIHGVDGTVDRFQSLVKYLDSDRPIYGIQAQALLQDKPALNRLEDMAAFYLSELKTVQEHGPYHLIGFSFGSLVAFEMARQLGASGGEVGLLAMLDNVSMTGPKAVDPQQPPGQQSQGIWHHLRRSFQRDGLSYAAAKLRARGLRTIYTICAKIRRPIPRVFQSAADINWFAAVHYTPQAFPGRIVILTATDTISAGRATDSTWNRLAQGGVEIREIPGKS